MPVTSTAKRALRSSRRKTLTNQKLSSRLEIALRTAKKSQTSSAVRQAISLIDRAVKNNLIHSNRAARLKGQLSKLARK